MQGNLTAKGSQVRQSIGNDKLESNTSPDTASSQFDKQAFLQKQTLAVGSKYGQTHTLNGLIVHQPTNPRMTNKIPASARWDSPYRRDAANG